MKRRLSAGLLLAAFAANAQISPPPQKLPEPNPALRTDVKEQALNEQKRGSVKNAITASRRATECRRVAAGTPGAPTWRLDLDRVTVVRARESGGDRPYFVALPFSSCFGREGTSQVTLVEREPHDWVSKPEYRAGVRLARGDHMSAGESLPIPDWMGHFEWAGLPMAEVSRGTPTSPPWFFGVVLLEFDNNNTPPHVIRNMMGRVRDNLLGVLRSEVESTDILFWSSDDWGRLQMQMSAGLGTFVDAFQLTIGSTFNPDKPIGIHLLAWYAATDTINMRQAPPTFQLTFTGGDRVEASQQLQRPRPGAFSLDFRGSGSVTRVDARLERDGGEPLSWQRVNERTGAVSIAACANGRLYALLSDSTLLSTDARSASNSWQTHGRLGDAARIACSGTTLYYLERDRELFETSAPAARQTIPASTRRGRPGGAATIAAGQSGDFPQPWALNDDRTLWYNTGLGSDPAWVRVGQPRSAAKIAAAPGRVFALNDDGTLWLSPSGRDGTWRRLDGLPNAVDIAVTARTVGEPATIYSLRRDGSLWKGTLAP